MAGKSRTVSLAIALVLATFNTGSTWALSDISESGTLRRWKETAKATAAGTKLVTLLEDTDRRIKHNSTDKKAYYTRGYLYGIIGCTSSAIHDLSRAIEIDPYYSDAYTERGICFMDYKLYKKALADLDRAVELNNWSGDARFARARLYLSMNKPYEAEHDLRALANGGAKFKPALPGELPADYYNATHYYLGQVYERLGRRHDAVREYRAFSRASRKLAAGYLHRYSEKPDDTKSRVEKLGYRL